MKILQVNKFYYRRGGAETYLLEIEQKLKEAGHEVAIFSMQHPKNLDTPWSKYFISRLSFNEGSIWGKFKGTLRLFYSFEAKRKFTKLVKDFKPDIIHLHNIYHQISPSILPVAKKYGIPVIMHLHDYKLICPNYQLFDGKRICLECLAPHYWQCFFKKCFGNSYLKSFIVSLEFFFHHRLLNIYEKNINLYIAPSQFMKDISVKAGVSEEKIKVLYNFTKPTVSSKNILKDYLLYVGRLSTEKGLPVLLKAIGNTSKKHLKIAGDGPQKQLLEKIISTSGLEKQVELLGHQEATVVFDLMREAKAIVIPSVWLENMPFSLLEAMSLGKVVIASKIGGLTELITDNENGFIFKAGDSKDLAKKINDLDTFDLEKIGLAAAERVKPLNLENHYQSLLKIYSYVLSTRS